MQNAVSTIILDEFRFEKSKSKEREKYVYKRRGVGSPKMSTFRQRS